jgi:hypothetical protein
MGRLSCLGERVASFALLCRLLLSAAALGRCADWSLLLLLSLCLFLGQ